MRPVDYHSECCIVVRLRKMAITESNTRDGVEIPSLLDGPISYRDGKPAKRAGNGRFVFEIETSWKMGSIRPLLAE